MVVYTNERVGRMFFRNLSNGGAAAACVLLAGLVWVNYELDKQIEARPPRCVLVYVTMFEFLTVCVSMFTSMCV